MNEWVYVTCFCLSVWEIKGIQGTLIYPAVLLFMRWRWSLFVVALQVPCDLVQKFLLYKLNAVQFSADQNIEAEFPLLSLLHLPLSLSLPLPLYLSYSPFLREKERGKWMKTRRGVYKIPAIKNALRRFYFTLLAKLGIFNKEKACWLFSQRLFPHPLLWVTHYQRQTGNQWATGLLSLPESSFHATCLQTCCVPLDKSRHRHSGISRLSIVCVKWFHLRAPAVNSQTVQGEGGCQ